MALNFIITKLSLLPPLFQASYDAVFSTLPFSYRWRLLLLQPINFLATSLTAPHWLLNNRFSVLYVPTRSGRKRCLVFRPSRQHSDAKDGPGQTRPLHVDFYGGGFIGGFPESDARWCAYLSDKTGAVVVAASYRHAPRYTFPAAHDDADDIVSWLVSHASDLDADPNLLTVGGSSVGANLALSASQYLHQRSQTQPNAFVARAFVGFCPPTNFRLKPQEKPRPPNFPKKDPLAFLLPLYDSYAGPNRPRDWDNPRLNPIIVDKETLPLDMLFIIAGIDILSHEALALVERVRGELEQEGNTEQFVEAKVWDKGFHGWLELPKAILEKERIEVFDMSVDLVKRVHRKYGFDIDKID